jgi:hypothetical protein
MSTFNKSTFHIGGTSVKVLRYARHRKESVTPEEVRAFFPHFFKRPYRARESMQRLENSNLLVKTADDSWGITAEGVAFLYATAPAYKGEHDYK